MINKKKTSSVFVDATIVIGVLYLANLFHQRAYNNYSGTVIDDGDRGPAEIEM